MIRHFVRRPRQRSTPEIGFLTSCVIQASLHRLLIITVVLTAVLSPGLCTAILAAVPLTSFAITANKEHRATKTTKPASKYKRLDDTHLPIQEGVDKDAELWEAGYA